MQIVEKVETPYGALVVETLWDGRSRIHPVGTVRVSSPGYNNHFCGEIERLTVGDIAGVQVDVLVLPDGTVRSHSQSLDITAIDAGLGYLRILTEEELRAVLPVIQDAAQQVQGREGFAEEARRNDALSRYRDAFKGQLFAEAAYRAAQEVLVEQESLGNSYGLGKEMDAIRAESLREVEPEEESPL